MLDVVRKLLVFTSIVGISSAFASSKHFETISNLKIKRTFNSGGERILATFEHDSCIKKVNFQAAKIGSAANNIDVIAFMSENGDLDGRCAVRTRKYTIELNLDVDDFNKVYVLNPTKIETSYPDRE